MKRKIAFWGAGAIGGVVGAHLIRGGHMVDLIDIDADHVDAVNKRGLELTGPITSFAVPAHALTPSQVDARYDIIFLGVKGHHTVEAAQQMAGRLVSDGVVVSLQNGLNHADIDAAVGPGRTLLCLINFAADLIAPGVIHYAGRGRVTIGEVDGSISARLRLVASLLRDFDPTIEPTDNVLGFLWGKLGYGAVLIATALTDETIADILDSTRYTDVLTAIGHEMMNTAYAAGVTPLGVDGFNAHAFKTRDPVAIRSSLKAMADHYRGSAKPRTGVWRDLAVRKRASEVPALFERVFQTAAQHGIAMPVTHALVRSIREIEAGTRGLSEENLVSLAA